MEYWQRNFLVFSYYLLHHKNVLLRDAAFVLWVGMQFPLSIPTIDPQCTRVQVQIFLTMTVHVACGFQNYSTGFWEIFKTLSAHQNELRQKNLRICLLWTVAWTSKSYGGAPMAVEVNHGKNTCDTCALWVSHRDFETRVLKLGEG